MGGNMCVYVSVLQRADSAQQDETARHAHPKHPKEREHWQEQVDNCAHEDKTQARQLDCNPTPSNSSPYRH